MESHYTHPVGYTCLLMSTDGRVVSSMTQHVLMVCCCIYALYFWCFTVPAENTLSNSSSGIRTLTLRLYKLLFIQVAKF